MGLIGAARSVLNRYGAIFGADHTAHRMVGPVLAQDDGGWALYGLSAPPWADGAHGDPMRNSTVFRCVELLSGHIACMGLQVFERTASGEARVVDHPVERLFRRGSKVAAIAGFELMEMLVSDVLLDGNAYCRIVRRAGPASQPTDLIRLDPRGVRVEQLDNMRLEYRYESARGGEIVLPREDVLHLRGRGRSGVRGMSITQMARAPIGIAHGAEGHQAGMVENGLAIDAYMHTEQPLQSAAIDQLQEHSKKWRGADGRGVMPVLHSGLKMIPWRLSPADAQLSETAEQADRVIARYFGVPLHMIGDKDHASNWGAGLVAETQRYIRDALLPRTKRIAGAINMTLLEDGPFEARFDLDALLEGDIAARVESLSKGVMGGIIKPNEARERLGMPPVGGGDALYPPPNMTRDENQPQEKKNEENSGRKLQVVK